MENKLTKELKKIRDHGAFLEDVQDESGYKDLKESGYVTTVVLTNPRTELFSTAVVLTDKGNRELNNQLQALEEKKADEPKVEGKKTEDKKETSKSSSSSKTDTKSKK